MSQFVVNVFEMLKTIFWSLNDKYYLTYYNVTEI